MNSFSFGAAKTARCRGVLPLSSLLFVPAPRKKKIRSVQQCKLYLQSAQTHLDTSIKKQSHEHHKQLHQHYATEAFRFA